MTTYFGYTEFDEMPWNSTLRGKIVARRAAMSGELFFDELLRLGGCEDPASIYPPHNMLSLTVLIDAILALSYDSMKRECLVYYLLKQLQEGKEVPFGEERAISPHYLAITDAYWELDSGINLDVSHITMSCISPTHTAIECSLQTLRCANCEELHDEDHGDPRS